LIQFGSEPRTSALSAPVSGIAAANESWPPSSIGTMPAAFSFAQSAMNCAHVVGGVTPALANSALL
jgi:hypothetical protein